MPQKIPLLGPEQFNADQFLPIEITSAALTNLRTAILNDPSLAPDLGSPFLVTDGLLANTVVYFTGDAFQPGNGLVSVNNPATFIAEKLSDNTANDTTITTAIELIVPGFLMGANTVLNICPYWQSTDVNSNTRNVQTWYFQDGTVNQSVNSGTMTGTTRATESLTMMRNCMAYNVQKTHLASNYGNVSANPAQTAMNTLIDWRIQFRYSWTALQTPTQASIRLNGYRLWI